MNDGPHAKSHLMATKADYTGSCRCNCASCSRASRPDRQCREPCGTAVSRLARVELGGSISSGTASWCLAPSKEDRPVCGPRWEGGVWHGGCDPQDGARGDVDSLRAPATGFEGDRRARCAGTGMSWANVLRSCRGSRAHAGIRRAGIEGASPSLFSKCRLLGDVCRRELGGKVLDRLGLAPAE